jgi:hypothetical protein
LTPTTPRLIATCPILGSASATDGGGSDDDDNDGDGDAEQDVP